MTVQLNIADDFATVIDGAEPITLKRRDSAATIPIEKAWRFSALTREPEPSGGHVAQADVVWQFPWDDASGPPRLGDALIDAAGDCFTILSVESLVSKTRLRCATRNLSIVHQLNDRVDVQKAIWEDTGSGLEIVGWTTIHSAVAARIQPTHMAIDGTTTPPTATATYRIVLGEQLAVDATLRFVDPEGSVYQLIELTQPQRIDALPVATVYKSTGDQE
jgi:hypothetical protein